MSCTTESVSTASCVLSLVISPLILMVMACQSCQELTLSGSPWRMRCLDLRSLRRLQRSCHFLVQRLACSAASSAGVGTFGHCA